MPFFTRFFSPKRVRGIAGLPSECRIVLDHGGIGSEAALLHILFFYPERASHCTVLKNTAYPHMQEKGIKMMDLPFPMYIIAKSVLKDADQSSQMMTEDMLQLVEAYQRNFLKELGVQFIDRTIDDIVKDNNGDLLLMSDGHLEAIHLSTAGNDYIIHAKALQSGFLLSDYQGVIKVIDGHITDNYHAWMNHFFNAIVEQNMLESPTSVLRAGKARDFFWNISKLILSTDKDKPPDLKGINSIVKELKEMLRGRKLEEMDLSESVKTLFKKDVLPTTETVLRP